MNILWQNLNTTQPSIEHALWLGQTVNSTVMVLKDKPFTLQYQLQLSLDCLLKEAELNLDGRLLSLKRDNSARWTVNNLEDARLYGCNYIDIQATPLTNTLPIRHLQLKSGQAADIKVAWVGVPSLEVKMMQQRYTRLETGLYRYQNLTSDYQLDVRVDDEGIVLEYPTRFIRHI